MPRKLIAHRGPYKLVALSASEATLYIYGAIGKGWWAETGIDAIEVINALAALPAATIHVRIASDGGSVSEGLAMANALRRHPAQIITHNDSIVASIASLIFCAGDERVMPTNTMAMLHGVIGDGGIGNATQIRENADHVERMSEVLVESYIAAVTDDHRAEVTAMLLDGKDHYLTADECLALGICTSVEEPLALAAIRRVDLSRLKSLPAAAAVYHQKDAAMNFKLIALALGLSVSINAADTDLRSAVFKELKLADTATDEEVEAALAARPKPTATLAQPAAVVTQPAAPTAAARVTGMFAAAMRGQENNARLLALQRQAEIDIQSGREPNIETLRTQLIDAAQTPAQPIAGRYVAAVFAGEDAREKLRAAGTAWLLQRSAVYQRGGAEANALAAAMRDNPFRGMSFADMARTCLEEVGYSARGLNRHDVLAAAITYSESDFPNIFENTLHKTLLAGFNVIPTVYDRCSKIGTLSDFRPHIRYRSSSIGDLDVVQPNGEYKTLQLNDAERESIQGKSRGGIVNISREMLVNDDMGVFSDLTLDLGKSSKRTREKAFFALLAMNAGMGPTLGDGKAIFHADHGNISAQPGAPTVTIVDKDRQQMASQKEPGGNDFVDIRPSIWLGPLALSGAAKVVNNDTFDPDANNKLQRSNIARNTYSQIIDTPRLTGTPWFSFADPNIEPVIEIGFLDGQQEPQLAMQEAFTQNGMKWRIVDEWGMAGVGFRGALRNAGA